MSGNYPAGVIGAESYFNPNTTAHCSECGQKIDTEQDTHGISLDGETYVCDECFKGFASLSSTKCMSSCDGFFAESTFKVEGKTESQSTSYYPSSQAALKRAAEMAEKLWEVKSFVEVN